MKVRIQILDDADQVIVTHEADASQPTNWHSRPEQKPLEIGLYLLHSFVWQPRITVRPDWIAVQQQAREMQKQIK